MKTKQIYSLSSIVLLLFLGLLSGCTFEQDNIFPDSPAVRMEKALSNYNDILCAAPNGWVMEYFPTDTTEGYTFIMKFSTSDKVVMAAKNRWINNVYVTDSCFFRLTADDGPVLSFPLSGSYKINGTQVDIFHMFANPEDPRGSSADLDGFGLGGDYEFIILKAEADLLTLKGKKRGTTNYLRKLDEGISWKGYFDQIDAMRMKLFSNNHENMKLVLKAGGSYILKNNLKSYSNYSNKFCIYAPGTDPLIDGKDYSFIITPKGVRFHTPFEKNNQTFQTFALSDDQHVLNCTDQGANGYITNESEGVSYIKNYITTTQGWEVSLTDTDVPIAGDIATINNYLVSVGGTQSGLYSLQLVYNKDRNSNVLRVGYKLSGSVDKQDFDFDVLLTGTSLALTYKGTRSDGAATLQSVVPGMSDLISQINGVYAIGSSITYINLTLGAKLIKQTDTSAWINITGGPL